MRCAIRRLMLVAAALVLASSASVADARSNRKMM